MKIIVLHWHGICPHCNEQSCIYADFYRTEDGIKLPNGFECGSCNTFITDEEFDKMMKLNIPCPNMIEWRPYHREDSKKTLLFMSKLGSESLRFFDRYDGSDKEKLAEISKGTYHKIIGLVNDEIIAFGYLWENDNYPNIPSLGIAVRDDWQGKGIGQQLMLKLIELGKKLQVNGIYLSVHPDNKVAIHIYKKLGWKVIGKRKDSPKLEMLREING